MKSANRSSKPAHITKGDLFDDLGFSRQETVEAKIKADIWQALVQHIDRHGLTPSDLTTALKASESDVSNLLLGKFSRFSITRLIQFAGRLNLSTQVKVTAPKSVRRSANKKPAASRLKRSLVSAS